MRSDAVKETVLLQVIKILRVDGENGYESVLWDIACSNVFVQTGHEEMMNFPYEKKRLRFKTLGGSRISN